MLDPHVHFRDWNEKEKETILHGMECGFLSGYDTFFDMPNTNPPIISKELAIKRIEDGMRAEEELKNKGITVYYHLYLGLTSKENQIKEIVDTYNSLFPRTVGLKLFASHSTGDMGIIEKNEQERIWKTLSELNYRGTVAVHAEKTELLTNNSTHSLSRPAISEIESVKDQIELSEKYNFKGNLHIAHVSTKGALDEIRKAKERGIISITSGATPHHALLSLESESYLMKMNPPLRDKEDRDAIFNALLNGEIDWIESDHAPHTLLDKENGKCGIPGFEGLLRLIKALSEKGISEELLSALTGKNALRTFKLTSSTLPPPENISNELIEKVRGEYQFSPWI